MLLLVFVSLDVDEVSELDQLLQSCFLGRFEFSDVGGHVACLKLGVEDQNVLVLDQQLREDHACRCYAILK